MLTNPQALEDDPVVKLVRLMGKEKAAKRCNRSVSDINDYMLDVVSRNDILFFDRNSLKIQTKNAGLIPFVDNYVQRKIQDAIDRQIAQGKPVRIKIPKARRHGCSTKVQSLFYRSAMYERDMKMLTVCHELIAAMNMREMFQRYYDHYPRRKPEKKGLADKWWKFKETDVSYLIATADEVATGRSFTYHRMHLSEVAFYRDAGTLLTGLLQSVDRNPNTWIIAESTANGFGGYWYDFVMSDTGYERLFFPWFDDPGNAMVFESEKKMGIFETSLSNEEMNLIDSFDLSLEQMLWRRSQIADEFNANLDKFRQEYPATLEESFLVSGRPYFPVGKVRAEFNNAVNAPFKEGYLEWKVYGKEVEFVEEKGGYWRVFSEPNKAWKYRCVTGSDVAEGVAVDGKTNKDPDFSVCTVFDHISKKDVARLEARLHEDVFGAEIYKASVYYSSGCDVVERNNSGVAVINTLKDKENVTLYQEEEQARTTDKEKANYGFRTSGGTRDLLLTQLRTWIREGIYHSGDTRFWEQCLKFVVDEGGVPRGAKGSHDDIVLSSALCIQGIFQAIPPERVFVEQQKSIPPFDRDIPIGENEKLPFAEF